jgi:SAM-dependent methyltransferase
LSADDWVKLAFNKEYLELYSHRDLSEAQTHCNSLIKLAKLDSKNLSIFDCCCGAGRYSQILQEMGFKLIGLDLSMDLLQVAKKGNVSNVRGDIRLLPFFEKFDRVLSLFTSFGYFENDEQNFNVLKEMSQSLVIGGYLYLDFLNPNNVKASDWEEKQLGKKNIRSKKEINENIGMVIKTVEIIEGSTIVNAYTERVKLYDENWFNKNIDAAGLKLEAVYGDYNGNLCEKNSPRNIYLLKKLT